MRRTRGGASVSAPNSKRAYGRAVDKRGATRDVRVVEATSPGVFDQAAITAVRSWRYQPMLVNGSAVEVPVTTRVRFELPK